MMSLCCRRLGHRAVPGCGPVTIPRWWGSGSGSGGGPVLPRRGLNQTVTTPMTGARRTAFSSMLFIAMGAATFTASSLGILATFIIDDLSITRAELGVVLAVVNIAAAMLAPLAGRLTDRIGGKRAIIALFVIAGATFVLLGTAVAYAMLLVGALAGAFSQATANPATNKMIAEELPAGERGCLL